MSLLREFNGASFFATTVKFANLIVKIPTLGVSRNQEHAAVRLANFTTAFLAERGRSFQNPTISSPCHQIYLDTTLDQARKLDVSLEPLHPRPLTAD